MILKIEKLHAYYGSIHALKGISMEVSPGKIVALIGPNGAGKTTLLKSILGMVPPRSGHILFDGNPIQGLPTEQIVRSGISYVPEGRRIFPLLTVVENLEMGAYLRSDRDEIAKDIEKIFELFPQLKDRRKQLGGSLSGGEQQMLALGRGLLGRPKLLLMDEPSLGLAPVLVDHIFEMTTRLNEEGITILLVEQNAQMALSIASSAAVLENGTIALMGSASELIENEQVKHTYLGM
jgi:branched-chain amino acid transport system ATP-binding protein